MTEPPQYDRTTDSALEFEQLTTAHSSSSWKVLGKLDDPTGTGVLGHNTATTGRSFGVRGVTDSSDDAIGVFGEAPKGEADGVIGTANNGGIGVGGSTDSPSQSGMLALNFATSGRAIAHRAKTDSTGDGSTGVLGQALEDSGLIFGVSGVTGSGTDGTAGVRGEATKSGVSAETYGVYGISRADGDFNTNSTPAGVRGQATGDSPKVGVMGTASGGVGVAGFGGWGLFTPDTARLEGPIDTGETDYVVKAGTTSTDDAQNVVLGHEMNAVNDGAVGATIGGGGSDDGSTARRNRVYDNYGTVAGGRDNQAGTTGGDPTNDEYATVGGGDGNEASDYATTVSGGRGNIANSFYASVGGGNGNEASNNRATVGGGQGNTASGLNGTIGGGRSNTSSASDATVGGGFGNTASGNDATVGGGFENTAAGEQATVPGGDRGAAESEESFVWNDGSSYHAIPNTGNDGLSSDTAVVDEPVTGTNTFSVSAQGGVRFITGDSHVTYIEGGTTGWTTTSSRSAKTNIDPVDPQTVLDGVEDLEVATWEYKDDDGDGVGTTHIGPMAEEFHEIIDLGTSDAHINGVNADGMLFAAVQGLSEKLEEKDDRIEDLEAANDRKTDRIDDLEDRLATLEVQVASAEPATADD